VALWKRLPLPPPGQNTLPLCLSWLSNYLKILAVAAPFLGTRETPGNAVQEVCPHTCSMPTHIEVLHDRLVSCVLDSHSGPFGLTTHIYLITQPQN